MKKLKIAFLAGTAGLLSGCLVTSVCPYFHQKDIAFEPGLLGSWTNAKEEGEHWKFERESTNAYQFTYTSDGKSSVMRAHFFKLGENSFLDMVSTQEIPDVQPPPIPSHFLLRVFQVRPAPRMAALNYDWLQNHLAKDSAALRHYVITNENNADDTRLVLTAETADLQQFILKHLKTEAAWKDDFELKRDLSDKESEAKSTSIK